MAIKKSSQRKAIGIGAGAVAAAALAAAAGAYFLSGKEGAKRKAAMKAWAVKARNEVAKQAKTAKRLSEAQYKIMVDRAVKKYGRLEDMSAADMMRAAADIKAEWDNVKKHAKMMAMEMQSGRGTAKRKPAKRKAAKKTRSTKKRA